MTSGLAPRRPGPLLSRLGPLWPRHRSSVLSSIGRLVEHGRRDLAPALLTGRLVSVGNQSISRGTRGQRARLGMQHLSNRQPKRKAWSA